MGDEKAPRQQLGSTGWVLLVLVLAAVPQVAHAAEAGEGTGRHLVWLEPLPSIGSALTLGPTYSNAWDEKSYGYAVYAVSGGYAFAYQPRRAWSVELFGMHEYEGCGSPQAPCSGSTRVRVSVGHPVSYGDAPHTGWLLEPRLVLGVVRYRESRSDSDVSWPQQVYPAHTGMSVQVGLDVGYQWRFGGFYVAPVLGVSMGVSHGVRDQAPVLSENIFEHADARDSRSWGFLTTANLTLLRMGWAF